MVDTWHSLTSGRLYRMAWPVNEAAAYLRQQASKQFEPRVVGAFLELIQEE